ncbi:PaaI family thioesterase [bacterium]|nr:PaaI family thioesterase [bacterium]
MEVNFSEKCFVCGKNNPDGLHLDIHRDDEKLCAEAEISVPDKFCGWEGIIHGGIISTLLDEIMAYAAFTHDQKGVTGEISVRFRKPMPSNRKVKVEGCVESQKGRVLCTAGKITLDGVLIAEATAKMVRLD